MLFDTAERVFAPFISQCIVTATKTALQPSCVIAADCFPHQVSNIISCSTLYGLVQIFWLIQNVFSLIFRPSGQQKKIIKCNLCKSEPSHISNVISIIFLQMPPSPDALATSFIRAEQNLCCYHECLIRAGSGLALVKNERVGPQIILTLLNFVSPSKALHLFLVDYFVILTLYSYCLPDDHLDEI